MLFDLFESLGPSTIEEINELIGRTLSPALLYVYSDDCVACLSMKPVVEVAYKAYRNVIPFALVNAQATPEVWEAFGLSVIPTCLIVGNEKALGECTGVVDVPHLTKSIDDAWNVLRAEVREVKRDA